MAMTFKHGAMSPPTTGGKEVPYACHLYENGETLPLANPRTRRYLELDCTRGKEIITDKKQPLTS
jgi:hypothetical protein